MVAVPKMTIGGVTLTAGDYGDKTWSQTLGVEPQKVTWDFYPADAAKILAGPSEVTIVMQDATGVTKTIKRVYVVREEGAPDDLVRRITFADVRFYLNFAWVRAVYNLRAATGTFRQVQPDAVVGAAPPPTVQNWTFAPYSLKGERTPFTANEIALDVLDRATKGHDFPAITVHDLSSKRASFVPNNVYVDDKGGVSVGQVLGALGGLDIRVNDAGEIEIVNAYLGAEKSIMDALVANYRLEWKGLPRWISMGNVAPAGATVLYTRRVEVRLDSWEGPPGADGNASTVGDDVTWGTDNTPTAINVIPVTDQSLPYPSATDPSIQGTLVPLSQYLKALGTLADTPAGTPSTWKPITRQKLLAGPGGRVSASPLLSETLEGVYVSDHGTGVGPNKLWAARCAAIKNFTRTLYKANPVIARNAEPGSWSDRRVGLLDAATGTRQPATVYTDFVQRPVGPGFATDDKLGWVTNGVPPTAGNPQAFPSGQKTYADPGPYNVNPFPLTQATAAPFQVQCVDPTNAVYYLSAMAQDTTKVKHAADVHMGLVWGLPTSKKGDLYRGAAFALWSQAQKLLTHRVALVVSAIPGGPNGTAALHPYQVTVAQALARLGAPADAVKARAPKRELRVRPGTALAGIPWDDTLRNELIGCFQTTGPGAPSDPSKLVPVNDPELRDFAVAVFANYMATMLDHYEGTMTIGFTPDVAPVGSLQQVQHTFTTAGNCYTTLRCVGVTPAPQPEALISQASRNILFRGIQL